MSWFTEGTWPTHAKACRPKGCMMCCRCWCHFKRDKDDT